MSHPTDEQLGLLLDESIPASLKEPLEQHVNSCASCLQRLESSLRSSLDDRLLLADLLVKGPFSRSSPTSSDTIPDATASVDHPRTIGEYDLLGCLGAGGMGVVFKARRRRLNRLAAIKLLLPGRDESAEHHERRARFHSEAQALARLRHPNIITLYEVGEHEGRPYLVLEWADGGTLADKLASRPQPERQAAIDVRTLAEAVEQAHQSGIIHRDLKPANVLLANPSVNPSPHAARSRGEGEQEALAGASGLCSSPAPPSPCGGGGLGGWGGAALKITDFGIAKCLDDPSPPTRCGQVLGTPEYMAPEQTGAAPLAGGIGPATDVYSLGAILYEMLTGRPPFRADTPLETLRQVREEEPIAPRCLRPKLSRDLETICLKCLNKNPSSRYPSARALADDLGRFLNGEPILARRTGWLLRGWRWCVRHPARSIPLALFAAFVLALLVGLLWQFRSNNTSQAEHLAAAVERQLPHLQRAVLSTARDKELLRLMTIRSPALRTDSSRTEQARSAGPQFGRSAPSPAAGSAGGGPGVRRDAPHASPLRARLLDMIEQFRRDFTLPGESQPFMSLFVLDSAGRELADSYNQSRVAVTQLSRRDYLRYFDDHPDLPADAVYFSDAYRSVHDGHFKFAVITRIWAGDRCIGFLAASIPLDSRLVGLNMQNERAGAMVAAPMDWSYTPEARGEERPDYLVVLKSDYDSSGGPPRWPSPEQLAQLRAFRDDPLRANLQQHFTADGGCADYVRIGQTHFIAVVEKRYPLPLCYLLDHRLAVWWLSALAVCVGLAGLRLLVRS
jgi:serine/threonine protein kinase